MRTYVIIPNFIVTEELKQLATDAIKSFRESSDAIIVSVDDCSPMDCTFLKELSDIYIRNEVNSGFAITCNNGFRKVKEIEKEDCYIIFANNDILVNKRVLPELHRPFEEFENVAISGIFSTMTHEWEGMKLEDVDLRRISDGGQLGDRMQDGGLVCSKMSVLDKIGIYDEQFIRGGYEDVDLFLRARDTFGMKIVMSNRAVYWHKQGATRWNCEKNGFINDFGRESKSIEQENLQKFIAKWGYNPHTRSIWTEKLLWNNN